MNAELKTKIINLLRYVEDCEIYICIEEDIVQTDNSLVMEIKEVIDKLRLEPT